MAEHGKRDELARLHMLQGTGDRRQANVDSPRQQVGDHRAFPALRDVRHAALQASIQRLAREMPEPADAPGGVVHLLVARQPGLQVGHVPEPAGGGREKEKQWIERQEVAVADRPSAAVVRERPDDDVHQHSADNRTGDEPLPRSLRP